MKTLTLLATLLTLSSLFAQSKPEALELYRLRGENSLNALNAAKMFEMLSQEENNKTEKCFLLNKASYLNFFHGSQLENTKIEEKFLMKSLDLSKICVALFMSDYNIEIVNKLDENSKAEIALSLYQGGTSLARYSEIKGTTTALKNWPNIKKRMNFIIQMKKSETSHYGAHRTLGIANTKMPSPFGSKDKAFKYLNLAVTKTLWNARGLSFYLYNSVALAEYFLKTKKVNQACKILKEAKSLTREIMRKENPDLFYENIVDQKRALKLFDEINC